MKTCHFDSQVTLGKNMDSFTQEQVQNEPMFYDCDPEFAYENGGPITRNFLDCLDELPVVLETRVHKLMPGWYPALPGYHHDHVPLGSDGQPDYEAPSDHSRHVMGLVNGEVAPTNFALGQYRLTPPSASGGSPYQRWHVDVVKYIDQGILRLVPAVSNRIIYFDWHTMHQATKAVNHGWRWFARASYQSHGKPQNIMPKHTQVYIANA